MALLALLLHRRLRERFDSRPVFPRATTMRRFRSGAWQRIRV